MVKFSIKVFARVRPAKNPSLFYEVSDDDNGASCLSIVIPKVQSDGIINNKKDLYQFRFNKLFDQPTKQDEVFAQVAKPVVDNCLEGYNGTIFAYGQTGSGKTFTITGGAEHYTDRGIIPRTLSYLFQEYFKHPGVVYTTHISYLEIYNESGYDLLDPKHEASKIEDLPKVSMYEDSDGSINLKNLSLHHAANEEEALNWLFLGDTNRIIAETPMNMASTRSHCIFTIHISSRDVGSHTIRKAKLHLVDLAGSERVSKSGVGGIILTEAKYINLSLHHLEQVIVALSEKSRSHIPYRNSMMTNILRDSLGGNCMTSMIATLSVEKRNIEETISTCRFAQRVALVKNEATMNEELDPTVMIFKLKQQVFDLKQELLMTTGEERADELTQQEKESVQKAVKEFVDNRSSECRLELGADMRKIHVAFLAMKRLLLDGSKTNSSTGEMEVQVTKTDELFKLKERLKQRDEEINILLKMLKQERMKYANFKAQNNEDKSKYSPCTPLIGQTSPIPLARTRASCFDSTGTSTALPSLGMGVLSIRELSDVRQEAFDMYRREAGSTDAIEKNKKLLRSKYTEAKSLGEKVKGSRLSINKLKSLLEKARVANELGHEEQDSDQEEYKIKQEMEKEKMRFKEMCKELKSLKNEIEHIQHLLETARLVLQQGFEEWWSKNSLPMQEDDSAAEPSPIPLLTGNTKTDEDIIAFYKARQKLITKAAN